MSEVRKIAEGLSEAQRLFLLLLPTDMAWRATSEDLHAIARRHGENALRRFGASGLVEGYYKEQVRHRLTPLGLQVRAILQEERS
jgi:hypothetical protein